MKKKYLLFLLLLILIKVNAKNVYTDYEFVEFQDNIKEPNSDLIKYEPFMMNRFYKEGEINIVYADKDVLFDDSPLIDLSDYKKSTSYFTYRKGSISRQHIDINKTATINALTLQNFKSNGTSNYIKEIEVFNNDEKITYSLTSYKWLNDNIKGLGNTINNSTFTLSFDDDYNLENLKIVVTYDNNNGTAPTFTLSYNDLNTLNEQKINIVLDNEIGTSNITYINFYQSVKYTQKIKEIGLYSECFKKSTLLCTYFEYESTWYKHYQIGKVYFQDSPLTNIDGYEYDESESYPLYMVFKREMYTISDEEINDSKVIEKEQTNNNEEGNQNEEIKPNPIIEQNEETIIENSDNNASTSDVEITLLNKDIVTASNEVETEDIETKIEEDIEEIENITEVDNTDTINIEKLDIGKTPTNIDNSLKEQEVSNLVDASDKTVNNEEVSNDVPYIAYTLKSSNKNKSSKVTDKEDKPKKSSSEAIISVIIAILLIIAFTLIIRIMCKVIRKKIK